MNPRVRPQALSPWNSAHLDVVRSLATLAVVAEHTYRLFFAVDNLPPTLLAGFAEVCSRIARESVMLFFVLSGFFICSIVKRSIASWTWSGYLIDRMVRLYLVLLPALIFTAFLDVWTARTAGASFFLNHALFPFLDTPIADHHTVGIFFGNLSFLQLVRVPAFGSDLPLWSLSSEFWYYMMFPCACLTFFPGTWRRRVVSGLLFACFVWFFPHRMVKYMVIWLLGAVVYWLPSVRWNAVLRGVMLSAVSLAFPILLFAPAFARWQKWDLDLCFSILFAAWVFILVRTGGTQTEVNLVYSRVGAGLTACSYSIYVTHFPVLLFIRSWRNGAAWPLSNSTALQGVGLVILAAGFGWIFAQATEAHTKSVRKLILKWREYDFGFALKAALNRFGMAPGRSQEPSATSE